jgi:toxin HigB-1
LTGRIKIGAVAIKGGLKGFWAVTVRANWRVVFRFADGDALEVDYVDYHWEGG